MGEISNQEGPPSMTGVQEFMTFSNNQLFSATKEDATPAKSFASQTTPQWVRNDALSPRAAPADADMSDTADPGKDGPAWALQMNTGHEISTPDLLGRSDLCSPLPMGDLPVLQRSESPVPSSRHSRGSSLSPVHSSSNSLTSASRCLSSALESVHSISELLLRDSQEMQEQPKHSFTSSEHGNQDMHDQPIMAQRMSSFEDESVHEGCNKPAGSLRAPEEPVPDETAAQPRPAPVDITHADSGDAISLALSSAVSGTSAPDLLQTPVEQAKAASGSCPTTSGGMPFGHTVVRNAAIVQSSLWQDTPEASSTGEVMGAASEATPQAEVATAADSRRRSKLQKLRQSVSRVPSFRSQPFSEEDGPPEGPSKTLQRPASSPACTNPFPDTRGAWARAGGRRTTTSYQGRSNASPRGFPASPRPSKPRMRGPALTTSQSYEGLQLQCLTLENQVATLGVGADSRSQLRAAANREADLQAKLEAMRSKAQAEAAARQEGQSKLAEQQREADKEKKALREQLEGKLRAARKEIAQLKSQVQVQPMTPQQKVAQRDTDTVQLSSQELDQIKRDMDEQENLIKGYQKNLEDADMQHKALQQDVKDLKAHITHLENCLQHAQAEKAHPKPNAPDAAQNLAAVLELQKQLQDTRDVAAQKESELAAQVRQLRMNYVTVEAELLGAERAHSQAIKRAAKAEEVVASLKSVNAQKVTDEGADLEVLSMKVDQVSTLQACLEDSEAKAAAAQARTSELQTTLAEMQRDLARKEAAIEEYSRAEEARKQKEASRRLSASTAQKENKGAGALPRVKELEGQLQDARLASARRESILKKELKVARQQLQEAPTRTATARLPPKTSAAQQPQRLKESIARLKADLAARKARIEQLEEQIRVQEEVTKGAGYELAQLTFKCGDLEAQVAATRQELQEAAAERDRLAAEVAAGSQRVAAAELAHRLLLHDRDSAIEHRAAAAAAQHQMQLEAVRAQAAQQAAAAESQAWSERVAAAEAEVARQLSESARLQEELRAARRGVPWTPKAAEFDALQQRIQAYRAGEETRKAEAVKAAQEAHKEQMAAEKMQVLHMRQELDGMLLQLESLKQTD